MLDYPARAGVCLQFWPSISTKRASLGAHRPRIGSVVDDCVELKTDVGVYNEKRHFVEPIQVPLDFTFDVAELQQPLRKIA